MAIDELADSFTVAGPCKITRADGSVEIVAPYGPAELQAIVHPPWKKVDKAKWATLMRFRREEARRLREDT